MWLSEVCNSYQEAAARLSEIATQLTIVVLDGDTNQALELIQKLTHANPNAIVLPASRRSDSVLILKAIRAGTREFLPLPAEPAEGFDAIPRLRRRLLRLLYNAGCQPGDDPGRLEGTGNAPARS
jgi:DNA-binding NarL/FixJ family response regulator